MSKKLILVLILAAIAAGVFFWLRASSSPGVEFEAVPAETAKTVTEFTLTALETYQSSTDPRIRRAGFAPLDTGLTEELEAALDQVQSPEFAKAQVVTPTDNPNTWRVELPDGNKTVRFVIKRAKNGKLQLFSCGVIN